MIIALLIAAFIRFVVVRRVLNLWLSLGIAFLVLVLLVGISKTDRDAGLAPFVAALVFAMLWGGKERRWKKEAPPKIVPSANSNRPLPNLSLLPEEKRIPDDMEKLKQINSLIKAWESGLVSDEEYTKRHLANLRRQRIPVRDDNFSSDHLSNVIEQAKKIIFNTAEFDGLEKLQTMRKMRFYMDGWKFYSVDDVCVFEEGARPFEKVKPEDMTPLLADAKRESAIAAARLFGKPSLEPTEEMAILEKYLVNLRHLYDKGLIKENEYEHKRNEALKRI